MKHLIREAWLEAAQIELLDHMDEAGYTGKLSRVSVGFPAGRGGAKTAIGQCFDGVQAEDGKHQIFISPTIFEPVHVLSTLLHEMVHATVGTAAGHKGAFKQCAVDCGLTGKMTATVPSEELEAALKPMIERLGEYPHSQLTPAASQKKQGTRLLKMVCPNCGWTGRTTQQWVDVGLPTCACGERLEIEATKGGPSA